LLHCYLPHATAVLCLALLQYANDIADLLAPQSGAYYDVWLDGEKFVSVYKEVRTAAVAGLQLAGKCGRRLDGQTAALLLAPPVVGQATCLQDSCTQQWCMHLWAHHILQDPKVTADRDFNGCGTNYTNSTEPIMH
jgi:hypothetical protein